MNVFSSSIILKSSTIFSAAFFVG